MHAWEFSCDHRAAAKRHDRPPANAMLASWMNTLRWAFMSPRQTRISASDPFAAEGKVKTTVSERRLDDINGILAELKEGQIDGRVVLSQL
jgi:D-arabinose 1-dehydrogenase-like Zn-dependent alcohol dehydrogenase